MFPIVVIDRQLHDGVGIDLISELRDRYFKHRVFLMLYSALDSEDERRQGLAAGADIPLHAVPSLALIVTAHDAATGGSWLATLDALRGDKYLALVELGADATVRRVDYLGVSAGTAVSARAAALGATLIGPDETTTAMPHARGVARCWAMISMTSLQRIVSLPTMATTRSTGNDRTESVRAGRAESGRATRTESCAGRDDAATSATNSASRILIAQDYP